MASTYSTNNGIELIGDGEQAGAWGATTNTNLQIIDQSLDGQVTITLSVTGSSGSPNLLTISDGALSNGRNRLVIFSDGGDLGSDAFVQLEPSDAEKVMFVRNSLSGSRSINLFQGSYNTARDYTLPNGFTAIVAFDGVGSASTATVLGELTTSPLQTANIGSTVQAWDADLDTYSATPLTTAELQQLQNIDGTTISTVQWGYLGAMGSQPLESGDIGTTVQAWDADLDTYSATPLTTAELQQLQNIGGATISGTQWGYVGALTGQPLDSGAIGSTVQAYDAGLQSIAGLTTVADRMIYTTGSDTYAVATLTSFGRSLIDDSSASAARTTLGAQASDQDLTDIAGVTRTRGMILRGGASAWQGLALGAAGRHLVSNGTDIVYSSAMSYSDVTASRAVNTNYTNTSTRPRAVVINLIYTGANTSTQFQIGGVSFSQFNIGQGFSGLNFSHSVIVPPGATYRCNLSGGSCTIAKWHEADI